MALVQKNRVGLFGLLLGVCFGLFLRTFRVLHVLDECPQSVISSNGLKSE